METMQKRQNERMDSLMEKRMKEVFARWLQENDYDEAAFLEKYSEEELVMQYVIGEDRGSIWQMIRAVRPRCSVNSLRTGSGKAGI